MEKESGQESDPNKILRSQIQQRAQEESDRQAVRVRRRSSKSEQRDTAIQIKLAELKTKSGKAIEILNLPDSHWIDVAELAKLHIPFPDGHILHRRKTITKYNNDRGRGGDYQGPIGTTYKEFIRVIDDSELVEQLTELLKCKGKDLASLGVKLYESIPDSKTSYISHNATISYFLKKHGGRRIKRWFGI